MKTRISILVAAVALSLCLPFAGCKKFTCGMGEPNSNPIPNPNVPDSIPCINSKITQLQNEPVRNPPAKVYKYQYNGQTVYYIPSYCCDMYSELLDANCNVICHPDGGITGAGDGNCSDFFTARTNEVLLWQDNR